jgi:N12 class adenine-specific DNA methylase
MRPSIAAQADSRFDRNVEALVKVQPRPLAHSDIAVKLGAGWIEADVVQAFSRDVLGEEMQGIRYEPATGSWIVPDSSNAGAVPPPRNGPPRIAARGELLDAVLNNRTIKDHAHGKDRRFDQDVDRSGGDRTGQ